MCVFQTYTFLVEGGLDDTNPAEYHPFYITDSSVGGFAQRSPQDQAEENIFAGVDFANYGNDGSRFPSPTAGTYCIGGFLGTFGQLSSKRSSFCRLLYRFLNELIFTTRNGA